jgi:hypothetical protein
VITGKIFAVTGYVWLCLMYGWGLDSGGNMTSFACYLMAFCWWVNNTLDGVAAKQVKRTGS